MNELSIDEKLWTTPPIKRAAYSDRTAWIMSELSKLVYEKLPVEDCVDTLVEDLKRAVEENDLEKEVRDIAQKFSAEQQKTNSLTDQLKKVKCELVYSFAVDGTDGMIISFLPHKGFEGILALVFRGTEEKADDIITDLKAELVPAPGGGRIHKGFLESYGKVSSQIGEILAQHKGVPLYITGHSLGGALAMVATRYLDSDGIGATYTYGCPRVADDEFYQAVKTPVYRVVNAADVVTRLPFGFILNCFLAMICLLPFNGTKAISEWFRRKFVGYTHFGSLIFLSGAPNVPAVDGTNYQELSIKKSPDIFWRIATVVKRVSMNGFKVMGNDHRITEYSAKLLAYAKRRNLN